MTTLKTQLIVRIIEHLSSALDVVERAAQTAYEAATHEENVAENKYDTLGLEASYLATGQARRAAELRQALAAYAQLPNDAFDPERGIQLGHWVVLNAADDSVRHIFIGPDAAGLTVKVGDHPVTVITPKSPLGMSLLSKGLGDEVFIGQLKQRQCLEIVDVV